MLIFDIDHDGADTPAEAAAHLPKRVLIFPPDVLDLLWEFGESSRAYTWYWGAWEARWGGGHRAQYRLCRSDCVLVEFHNQSAPTDCGVTQPDKVPAIFALAGIEVPDDLRDALEQWEDR